MAGEDTPDVVMVEKVPKDYTLYAARSITESGKVAIIKNDDALSTGEPDAQFHTSMDRDKGLFKKVILQPPSESK